MTQTDISPKVDIGENTLSRFEMEKSNMRIDTFVALVDALDVMPNDLSPVHLTLRKSDRCISDIELKFNIFNEQQKSLVYETMASLMLGLAQLK